MWFQPHPRPHPVPGAGPRSDPRKDLRRGRARCNGWTLTYLAALVPLLGGVVASHAQAWDGLSSGYPKWCNGATYEVVTRDLDGLSAVELSDVTHRAMDQWPQVACVDLDVQGEDRPEQHWKGGDQRSTIQWLEHWSNDRRIIGMTLPRWRNGCLIESDMILNAEDFRWKDDVQASLREGDVHAHAVLVHEAGHYYGLGHSDERDAAMAPYYEATHVALSADDRQGVCSLYPHRGAAVQSALRSNSAGLLCSPCQSSADCHDPLQDLCLLYPDGASYCGAPCGSSSDCPADAACAALDDGKQYCVAMWNGSTPDCHGVTLECTLDSHCESGERCGSGNTCVAMGKAGAEVGQPCTQDTQCRSGACRDIAGSTRCTVTCDTASNDACPEGFACIPSGEHACSGGLCSPLPHEGRNEGEPCDSHQQCSTLRCVGGSCAIPCVLADDNRCGEGWRCVLQDSACGYCEPGEEFGSPCTMDDDCESGLCVEGEGGGQAVCSSPCATAGHCPTGFSCEQGGDEQVCVPASQGCACALSGSDSRPHSPTTWGLLLAMGSWLLRRRRRP